MEEEDGIRIGLRRRGWVCEEEKGLESDGFRAGWALICSSFASGLLCKCDAIEAEFLFGIKGRKSHLHLWQEQVFHWEGKCSGRIEIP